jgi:hypothetical protein
MRNYIYSIILLVQIISCGKPEVKTTTIQPEVKNLFAFAKVGSYYIFEDSISGRQDSVYIKDYFDALDYTQYCKNSYTPQRIDITYKSTLDDYKYSWNITVKTDCNDSLNSIDFRRNIGGTPTIFYTKSKGFYGIKNQNQGDTLSIMSKYKSMTVNGNTFNNVYYFNRGDYNFYWAENIGIIKYNQDRLGTLNGVTYFAEVWKLKRHKIIN